MTSQTPVPGFYGGKNVAMIFLIYMFTLGMVFYADSTIFPAMINALEWNRGSASIAHTLNMLLSGAMIPLTGFSTMQAATI